MDFFLQQQMPRSDVSTIVGFVPQKGHYGVAHVCGDPDKRAVLDDRPNRAEPTSPPPSITVAAHNPTYARRTTRGGLVASLAALQPTFSVFGAMASKPTVSRVPHLRRLPNLSQRGSSTFRRVAGHLRPLVGGHRQLSVCHHVWPDKVRT